MTYACTAATHLFWMWGAVSLCIGIFIGLCLMTWAFWNNPNP